MYKIQGILHHVSHALHNITMVNTPPIAAFEPKPSRHAPVKCS